MSVAEQQRAGDNTTSKKGAINEKVLKLFADTPRLLENFRTFATPCSKIKNAHRSKKKWEVSHDTKFPVAFYDKHGKLRVAKSDSDLKKSLVKLLGVRQVLLFEVPMKARFVWIEFGWGQKPTIINPKTNRPPVLDQHALERVEKTWRLLFADVPRFRLGFSVDATGKFKLMEGVIVGYR